MVMFELGGALMRWIFETPRRGRGLGNKVRRVAREEYSKWAFREETSSR